MLVERHSDERVVTLDIYTDGSLKKLGTSTFGGWAFIASRDNKVIYYASGNEDSTTNQRMELLAIIRALEYATANRQPNEKVCIYSDSAYAINCYLQQWYIKWQKNGWRTAAKTEVLNKDLWMQIIPFFNNFWYEFKKVEGHAGVYWNEWCDEMAQNEADKLKYGVRG